MTRAAARLTLLTLALSACMAAPAPTVADLDDRPSAPSPSTTAATSPSTSVATAAAAGGVGAGAAALPSASTTRPTPSARPTPSPTPRPTASSAPVTATALTALMTLAVKGRAPKTGYDRALFGQTWSDDHRMSGGRNGCDTRNDVLRRDLTRATLKPGTNGCVVATGTLVDPYGGASIPFVRGQGTSSRVQVDHLVSLSNAWQTGAQQLSVEQRQAFANDPLNLLAVQGSLNQQKGDGDAATWLPPRKSYRCTYAARQVAVKQRHDLWVTPPERDALRRILDTCPGQRLPTAVSTAVPPTGQAKGYGSGPSAGPAPSAAAPMQRRAPTRPAPTRPTPSRPAAPAPFRPAEPAPSVSYPNCAAVRAAGAAPLLRGQPGYERKLDRDGDGIACE